jgi:eukaryotic-like serine/threonine-protein kinase
MPQSFRIAKLAIFAAVLSIPGWSQAPSAEEKAKTKARNIAQTFEANARRIMIFDRQGKVVTTVACRGLYNQPVLSPDAKKVSVVDSDLENDSADIWVFDIATGDRTRITASKKSEQARAAVWSPDGSQLAYVALRNGSEGIYRKAANGRGEEELLYKLPGAGINLTDWSRDGKFLNYSSSQLGESILYSLPLSGDHNPTEITKSSAQMLAARFSPDGRFIAYPSDECGKPEVYVGSFDSAARTGGTGNAGAGKWQISAGGLGIVAWRRDGQELFYFASDRGIMSSSVATAPTFEFGEPKLLFKAADSIPMSGLPGQLAGVSRDGQRFVFVVPAAPPLRQITVLDRQGERLRTVGELGLYQQPALSPDGSRLVVVRIDPQANNVDI